MVTFNNMRQIAGFSRVTRGLLIGASFARALATTTTKQHKVTLVTFDVDGTLIHGSSSAAEVSAHARAFSYGVAKLFAADPHAFQNKYQKPLDAIDPKWYHGSTDGLIALKFAEAACNVDSSQSFPLLNEVFREMHDYCRQVPDEIMMQGIEPLPGVILQLNALAAHPSFTKHVLCGLVTGNVEGIARKKMRSCGIFETNVLSRSSEDQTQCWEGEETCSFLGGFGSDFCSGDLKDESRIYKDRGEQIVIAYRRAQSLLTPDQIISRVVHVGDAPGDVLAAKYCSEENKFGDGVVVSSVAVATGKFTAEHLSSLFGEATETWDPICLAQGIADPRFIEVLKIEQLIN